ncbi:hypothetical protein [Alienimonas californiensis]|uniref:Uncharacterized protein n=1 Tax=Alienimonas californiensis TaxID=2527989 RepID=A0A517P650_9PLAN|nr:hypothetical protein [Alienimonas californiensis]QDT14835.1 hypothetical protein CA12_09150 [Alienimonas californiensis]
MDDPLRMHLISGLRELADLEVQRTLWTGQIPHQMGCFTEAVCRAFDDSNLDEQLEDPLGVLGLGPGTTELLGRLLDAVRSVDEGQALETMIESPEMHTVRRLAAAALESMNVSPQGTDEGP